MSLLSYLVVKGVTDMGIFQNMRVTTVVLSYRRAILISVYTHLLCKCLLPSSISKESKEADMISLRCW